MGRAAENRTPPGAAEFRPPRRRTPLTSIEAVRREQTRLYFDAREGLVPVADAARLGYLLSELVKSLLAGRIESRLDALENGAALLLGGDHHLDNDE